MCDIFRLGILQRKEVFIVAFTASRWVFFNYQNKLSDIFSVCSPEWGTLSVDKNVHP